MDFEKQDIFSFSINTNSDVIAYNKRGIEKLEKEDKIILSTYDPLGRNIVMWDNTFTFHILGEPGTKDSRHYLADSHNKIRITRGITNPTFIIEDKDNKDRFEYLTMLDINHYGRTKLQHLAIIIEPSDSVQGSLEVVTMMPKSRLSVELSDRKVIYNEHNVID